MAKKSAKEGRDTVTRLEAPTKRLIHAIDVSPDGTLIAAAQQGGKPDSAILSLLDVKTARVVRVIEKMDGEAEAVYRVAFAPHHHLIAYVLQAGAAFRLKVFDLERGTYAQILEDQQSLMIQGLGVTTDGQHLAVSGPEVRVIDVTSRRVTQRIPVHLPHQEDRDPNVAAAISPDGVTIAVGGVQPGHVTLRAAQDGSILRHLEGPFGGVARLGFDRSSKIVAAMDEFGQGVFMWDVGNGRRHLEKVFSEDSPPLYSMRFSAASNRFAVGMISGYVMLYDTDTGEDLVEDKLHKGRVTDVCLSPDGKLLFSAGEDHQIFVRHL